jgi:hypothetical protein
MLIQVVYNRRLKAQVESYALVVRDADHPNSSAAPSDAGAIQL